MMEILLNASLVEKLSKKGTTYTCVEIQITPTLKKQVFLEPAELELVKLYYKNSKSEQL